ncbi:MAG: n-acetylglutamate synthase [Putridiphycobacter sp.]|nr:n-acetylglutamate synthase [Putridiphycobacter sp.]
MNYHNRKFKPVSNSANGLVSSEMVFHYTQHEEVLSCEYAGQDIKHGQILGIVYPDGSIEFAYQQIDFFGQILTGKCETTPEILPNGKLRLHEKWQWTSGDKSTGESILEEI